MKVTSEAFYTCVVSKTEWRIPGNQKDPFIKFFQTHYHCTERCSADVLYTIIKTALKQRCWDFNSPQVHSPFWWSFVWILTSNLESEQWVRLEFKTSIYRTPKSLRFIFNESIFDCFSATSDSSFFFVYVFFLIFWWFLWGAEIGGEEVYITWQTNRAGMIMSRSKNRIEWSRRDDKFRYTGMQNGADKVEESELIFDSAVWRDVLEMGHVVNYYEPRRMIRYFSCID